MAFHGVGEDHQPAQPVQTRAAKRIEPSFAEAMAAGYAAAALMIN
jgi:hypothetical protein